jgi:hypothetical protein
MPWPTIEVESWQRFIALAERLVIGSPQDAPYVIRGQADSAWELTPSLLRLFPQNVTPEQALAVEKVSVEEFQAQAHLHLSAALLPSRFPTAGLPEWWALMQHHHAPSRLLDWTRSPYVAAYFAVEQELDKPGAVFVVHVPTASSAFLSAFPDRRATNEHLENPQAPQALLFWEPSKKSERFVAQQGYFSLNVNVLGTHNGLIEEQCAKAKWNALQKMFHEKWIIPSGLKLEFLRKLRAMNIAAHSLFPGIDGLGRSLGEVARLAAVARADAV